MKTKLINKLEADILKATDETKHLRKALAETLAEVERQDKVILKLRRENNHE